MNKYILILKMGFSNMMSYRLQMLLWTIVSTLPGIFSIFVFRSFISTDIGRVTVYFLLGSVIRLISIIFFEDIIQNNILNGNLSLFLLKPASFILSTFMQYLSGPLIKFAMATPFIIFVFIYIFRSGYLPILSIFQILLIIFAVILGYLLSAAFCFIFGFLAFWIERPAFLNSLLSALVITLSGSSIPLYFFPNQTHSIIYNLPFRYLLDFQITLVMQPEKTSILDFVILIAYIVLAWIIAILIYRKGLKRYEAFGN